jgi:hypothetical protein
MQQKYKCSDGFNHLTSHATPLAKSFSESYSRIQEITCYLQNPKVDYQIHNSPAFDCILKYINFVHNLASCKLNIHLISFSQPYHINAKLSLYRPAEAPRVAGG